MQSNAEMENAMQPNAEMENPCNADMQNVHVPKWRIRQMLNTSAGIINVSLSRVLLIAAWCGNLWKH